MVPIDPFHELGLPADADAGAVRAARRRLAREHHPDQGGDAERMQRINEAADAALVAIGREDRTATESVATTPTSPDDAPGGDAPGDDAPGDGGTHARQTGSRFVSDIPSFTVEALPVETFEALLVVTSWMGEVLDDEPPYRLDTYLSEPFDCWCRLDVVPDAGASTVSITIAGLDGASPPDVVAVRDAWVANLNAVDWD